MKIYLSSFEEYTDSEKYKKPDKEPIFTDKI